jgi:hypothetical protein
MRTATIVAIVAAAVGLARPAAAQSVDDPGAALAAAAAALAAGDHQAVVDLARPIADRDIARADLAEAHRLLGLAYFFLGDTARAEAALLAYLRLDLDARLDPSLVPPEAVTFFEDVRSRHAAELRKLRPRQRRYKILNLVPPAGQLQNRQRTKALAIGGAELILAAANVTTYLMLRSWCQRTDFTCVRSGGDATVTARRLRTINYASGIALIGVYLYGVVDGFRSAPRGRERPVVGAAPVDGGFVVGASLRF